MFFFSKKFTIVVVCKANITRSAYLHGYIEHYLKERMPHVRKKVRILSAGVKARRGSSASQVVKHVAKLNGFSLEYHHSDPISQKIVKSADVIIVMEQYQKEAILEYFPEAHGKTFRMTEYLWSEDPKEIRDIPDPTGQGTADYEEFMEVAHSEADRILRELTRKDMI